MTKCYVRTGVPGTGKTTVADLLRTRGENIISLFEFAQSTNCILNLDEDFHIITIP